MHFGAGTVKAVGYTDAGAYTASEDILTTNLSVDQAGGRG
jgi:hypothetical protein